MLAVPLIEVLTLEQRLYLRTMVEEWAGSMPHVPVLVTASGVVLFPADVAFRVPLQDLNGQSTRDDDFVSDSVADMLALGVQEHGFDAVVDGFRLAIGRPNPTVVSRIVRRRWW